MRFNGSDGRSFFNRTGSIGTIGSQARNDPKDNLKDTEDYIKMSDFSGNIDFSGNNSMYAPKAELSSSKMFHIKSGGMQTTDLLQMKQAHINRVVRQKLEKHIHINPNELSGLFVTHANSMAKISSKGPTNTKTVTIHYKVKNTNFERGVDKRVLEKQFVKRYMKFENKDASVGVWGLVQAKKDFQKFLEKLKQKIFVIKIPEDQDILNKDLCDYYGVIKKVISQQSIVKTDEDLCNEIFEDLLLPIVDFDWEENEESFFERFSELSVDE